MDQSSWIAGLIIGALLSIPLSILANLITPRVQEYIERRAIFSRSKSLYNLKTEHERIKQLQANPALLNVIAHRQVVAALSGLYSVMSILLLIWLGLTFLHELRPFFEVFSGIAIFVLAIGSSVIQSRLSRLTDDLIRLSRFEKYEAEMEARIKRLENDLQKNG